MIFGLGMVMAAYAFGHCSAFGGTCPQGSSFDVEVFRLAASGAALAVGVPVFLARPGRDRLRPAVVWTLVGGITVGLVVATAVTG